MYKGEHYMIRSFWFFGDEVPEMLVVRRSVSDPVDLLDKKSMQLILKEDDLPVAAGSLYFDNGAYHIAHLCVLPELQRHYLGDMAIRILLVKAFRMEASCVRCTPPASARDFFARYGFRPIGQTEEMEVTPETLIMQSKCGHDCSVCANKCH